MRKVVVPVLALAFIIACTPTRKTGAIKTRYKVIADTETKVLQGYIDRSVLEHDTAFKWFAENLKYGTADPAAVQAFKDNAASFNVVIFGGTWCHDTQNLLPVFYRLVEKSGFPEKNITIVALDRSKNGPDNMTTTYHVTNVPTFIVMKDGKEVGRVVEYGKEGQIDKELGEIVAANFGVSN